MRIPLLAAFLIILLPVIVDWLIWLDICRFEKRRLWSRIYGALSLLFWTFSIVIVCIPKRDVDYNVLPMMWMLYTWITIFVPKCIYVVFSLLGRTPTIWKGKRLRLGLWAGVPVAVFTFAVLWWSAVVGRRQIEVTQVSVTNPRIPESFAGYRIVQFSDAHVGTWGTDTTFVSRLVDTVNSLKPDLILFTGDIVNRRTDELKPFLSVLSRLHARDGVMSVLGNHDYGDYIDWPSPEAKEKNMQLMHQWQADMGWELLDNRSRALHCGSDSIMIIGVGNWGEPPFHQYGDLKKAYPMPGDSLASLTDARYKILLTHNPEHWRQVVTRLSNIDFSLAGHTHAMQFIISLGKWRWSPSEYIYKQWAGLYAAKAKDGTPMNVYVNIGSGEVGMPYRVGAPAEVTLFILNPDHSGTNH